MFQVQTHSQEVNNILLDTLAHNNADKSLLNKTDPIAMHAQRAALQGAFHEAQVKEIKNFTDEHLSQGHK